METDKILKVLGFIFIVLAVFSAGVYGCMSTITYQFEDKYTRDSLDEVTLVRFETGTDKELFRGYSDSETSLNDYAEEDNNYDVLIYRDDYSPYKYSNIDIFSTGNPAVFGIAKRVCTINVEKPTIGSTAWLIDDEIILSDRFSSFTETYIDGVPLDLYDLDHTIIFEVFNSSGDRDFIETIDVTAHTKRNESGTIIENGITDVSTIWSPDYDDKFTYTVTAILNDASCISAVSDSGTTYLNIYQNDSGLMVYDAEVSPDTVYPNIAGEDTVSVSATVSTKDIPYTITIRQGNENGAIVKTFSGTTDANKIVDVWDGRDDLGDVVSDGAYHVNISVTDFNDNYAEATKWAYVDTRAADSIPPVIDIIYPANNEIIAEVTPTITAEVTDEGWGVDFSTLVFKVDGVVVTPTIADPVVTYTPTTALDDGEHTIYIYVEDLYENTALREQTFTVNSNAPSISGITLTPNPVAAGGDVVVSATVTDSSGVDSVFARINGTDYSMADIGGDVFSTTFSAPSVSTDYTVMIFANDSLGDTAQASETLEVKALPDLLIYSYTINTSETKIAEGETVKITVDVNNAGDYDAVSDIIIEDNGVVIYAEAISVDALGTVRVTHDYDTLAFGPHGRIGWHTLYVAVDTLGIVVESDETNNDASLSFEVVDITPAEILTIGPSGDIHTSSIKLYATTDEDAVCRFDVVDVDYSSMANTFSMSGDLTHEEDLLLSDGDYVFYVRCIDSYENVNPVSASAQFTIDTNPYLKTSFNNVSVDQGEIFNIDFGIENYGYSTADGNITFTMPERFELVSGSNKSEFSIPVGGSDNFALTVSSIWWGSYEIPVHIEYLNSSGDMAVIDDIVYVTLKPIPIYETRFALANSLTVDDSLQVLVGIYNRGVVDGLDVPVSIRTNGMLEVVGYDSTVIGKIEGNATECDTLWVPFNVRGISEGIGEIIITVDGEDISRTITVLAEGLYLDISVTAIAPFNMSLGRAFETTAVVYNTGNSTAYLSDLSITLEDGLSVIDGDVLVSVGDLAPTINGTSPFTYTWVVNSTTSGMKQINMTFNYWDGHTGTMVLKNASDNIHVNIFDYGEPVQPFLTVTEIAVPEIVVIGGNGKIIVEITNDGTDIARNVVVSLTNLGGLAVDGDNEIVLGDIPVDGTVMVEWDVTGVDVGDYDVNVHAEEIQYMFNQQLSTIKVRYNHNVGWLSINTPSTAVAGSSVNVGGVLLNTGINNETDVNVTLLVDSVVVDSRFYNISADGSVNVIFLWTAQVGMHELTLSAVLEGDQNSADDMIKTSIVVSAKPDDGGSDNGGSSSSGGGSRYIMPVSAEPSIEVSYVETEDTMEQGRIYHVTAKVTNNGDESAEVSLSVAGMGVSYENTETVMFNRFEIIKTKWIVPKDSEIGLREIEITVSSGSDVFTYTREIDVVEFTSTDAVADRSFVEPDEVVLVVATVPVDEAVEFYLDSELVEIVESGESNEVSVEMGSNDAGQHVVGVEAYGETISLYFAVKGVPDSISVYGNALEKGMSVSVGDYDYLRFALSEEGNYTIEITGVPEEWVDYNGDVSVEDSGAEVAVKIRPLDVGNYDVNVRIYRDGKAYAEFDMDLNSMRGVSDTSHPVIVDDALQTPSGNLLLEADGRLTVFGWVVLLLLALVIGIGIRLRMTYKKTGKVGLYEGDEKTYALWVSVKKFFDELLEEEEDIEVIEEDEKAYQNKVLEEIKAKSDEQKGKNL